MRKIIIWMLAYLVFGSGDLNSQTVPPIERIEVNYKVPNLLFSDTSNVFVTNVYPETIIVLAANANISKIYFKIIRPLDGFVLYDVNYSLSSTPIINSDGITLFERDNSTIRIINPNYLPINIYSYELFTEDDQGKRSAIFSEIH